MCIVKSNMCCIQYSTFHVSLIRMHMWLLPFMDQRALEPRAICLGLYGWCASGKVWHACAIIPCDHFRFDMVAEQWGSSPLWTEEVLHCTRGFTLARGGISVVTVFVGTGRGCHLQFLLQHGIKGSVSRLGFWRTSWQLQRVPEEGYLERSCIRGQESTSSWAEAFEPSHRRGLAMHGALVSLRAQDVAWLDKSAGVLGQALSTSAGGRAAWSHWRVLISLEEASTWRCDRLFESIQDTVGEIGASDHPREGCSSGQT